MRYILLTFSFLLIIATAAISQDILLSTPDRLNYTLPGDIEIQSAAELGDVVLAAWGTQQANPTGAGVRNALVMQVARGGKVVGSPQLVHSDSGIPHSMVSVVALQDRFCVFWNDRRPVGSGLYMRAIDTLGKPIGEEVRLGSGTLYGVEPSAELPTSRIIVTSTGHYILRPDGTTDPRPVVVDLWKYRSYSILQDTSVVVITADSVLHYKSVFDSTIVASAWIGTLDKWLTDFRTIVVDSLGQIHAFYAESYDTAGTIYNPFLHSWETGTFKKIKIVHCRFDSFLKKNDNDSVVDKFIYATYPQYNNPNYEYKGTSIIRMCSNSEIGIAFKVLENHSEVFLKDEETFSFWLIDKSSFFQKISSYPQQCGLGLPIRRKSDSSESIVSLVKDSITFVASITPVWRTFQSSNPLICNDNNILYLSYLMDGTFYTLMKWDGNQLIGLPAALPKGTEIPLPTKRVIYGEFLNKPDYYSSNNLFLTVQNSVVLAKRAYRRDYEVQYSHNGSSQSVSHHQGQIETFISRDSVLEKINLWRKDDVGNISYYSHIITFDPNLSEVMHVVPQAFVCGKIQSKNVKYQQKPFKDVQPTSQIVAAGYGSYLLINGTKSSFIDSSSSKIGDYSIPPASGLLSYQRIFGEYFLRLSKPDTASLRLETFALDCTPINSVVIPYATSTEKPFVLQNPKDSSFILLYGTNNGVRATILDQQLKTLTADSLISTITGKATSPNAVFRNDTLYFVYSAYNSSNSAGVYGNGITLPNRITPTDSIDIIVDGNPNDTIPVVNQPSPSHSSTGAENVMLITPNVVSTQLNLRFNNKESGGVIITLYSPLGDVVATAAFPLVLAGEQTWSWEPTDVANGMYRLSLQTSTGRFDAPVIIAK